ncbi:MAG: ACP S-malonyltransferase [Deltaproteobacteria bacterium]|nr:ACP S-malonyltransferase [Deltaproteobacteria bacterium]
MTLVFMFPGQSSCYSGMIDRIAGLRSDLLAPIVEEASAILGRDLAAQYREDNPDAFAKNVDIQVGVFLANHLFNTFLEAEGIVADRSLGLSLGEWNHVVHIQALSFREALPAVEARGRVYDAGPRGMMASVFPISVEELEEVAARVRDEGAGIVEVVNLNSPRQQVLSGDRAAIERALALVEEETFAQATIIEREVPMHCSTFEPVAERFAEVLRSLTFHPPRLSYMPNRLGEAIASPTAAQWVELLSTHVSRPVLWQASIDAILAEDPEAAFVEVGPRKVLYNLLDRKWHKGVRREHVDSTDELDARIGSVLATLREWM